MRGEDSIAELCRREGINQNLYYRWSKEFLEAGKKRLAGDTVREASSDQEKALREATVYIDGTFSDHWIGEHPGSSSQVLAWPRNGAVDSEGRSVTGISQRVKDATARLALEGSNAFLSQAEDRGGRIARAKVGPLDVSYFSDAPAGTAFPFLGLVLKALLKHGGDSGAGLVRV